MSLAERVNATGLFLVRPVNVFGSFSLWEPTCMHCVYLRDAVNTQGFVWKFLCAIYTFSFIHSCVVETLFIHLFVSDKALSCLVFW